jgi:hypothetical protein
VGGTFGVMDAETAGGEGGVMGTMWCATEVGKIGNEVATQGLAIGLSTSFQWAV